MNIFSGIKTDKTVLCMTRKDRETFTLAGYKVGDAWVRTHGRIVTAGEIFDDADANGWFIATHTYEQNGYLYQMFVTLDHLAPVAVLLNELKLTAATHDRTMFIQPDKKIIDVLNQANGKKITFCLKIEFSAKRYTLTHFKIEGGVITPLWAQVDAPSAALSLRCLGYFAPSCPAHATLSQLRSVGWRSESDRSESIKDLYFYSVEVGDGEHFGIDCSTDLQIYKATEQRIGSYALQTA